MTPETQAAASWYREARRIVTTANVDGLAWARHMEGLTLETLDAAIDALKEREKLQADMRNLEQNALDVVSERDDLRRQLDESESRVRELEARLDEELKRRRALEKMRDCAVLRAEKSRQETLSASQCAQWHAAESRKLQAQLDEERATVAEAVESAFRAGWQACESDYDRKATVNGAWYAYRRDEVKRKAGCPTDSGEEGTT